jgi:PAS domain S-box-containing protein
MIEPFRFSPSRLALSYVALSVVVLALFAIPLWYAWSINLTTFKEYVHAEDVDRMVELFRREGASGLAKAIESQAASYPPDQVMLLADASKSRIAGNLPAWPAAVPELPGTYGLVIGLPGSSMRVVASHGTLPGGYHLLLGRESARFQSLVDYFWFAIAAAMAIILTLGAVIFWLVRRALLSEVQELSNTARAIAEGNRSLRLTTHRSSSALSALARTVNGMLKQLSEQNVQLADEIAIRRRAEEALQQAHQHLERLVAQRTEQLQQSNESLRRSEAYLAEAQQLAGVGSFGIKIDSRELVCSEETMRLAAFEPGTKPTLEDALLRVHPKDRLRIEATLEQGLRDRSLLEYEHRLLLPDGSIRHVHVVGRTIQDAAGGAEFVGAVVDITDQKNAQDALRAAKARFEGIVEIAEDAIISVDSSQRVVLFNRGAEKVFGYDRQEIVGRSLDLLVPPRFMDVHRGYLQAFGRSPDIARIMGQRREVFGVRKDGREFPAEASISKLDLEGELVFTVILRDVSERKRAEEELLRQRTYLDELFEIAPDAVVLSSLKQPRILRVNREFTRMFGYTAEEALGQRLLHLIAPHELQPLNLAEDPDLASGGKVEREVIRQRKDGTQFHAHITAKSVQLQDDEDAAYLIYRDITERKRAEALLAGEKRLLEVIAKGGPLATTLDALCRLAEEIDHGSLVSILLLDAEREHFRHGAAPSLPPSYIEKLDGHSVDPGFGPCGAAARREEQVIASDMATDQRWPSEYRSLALAHGLRACWSTPVMSSEGSVLGTFAIYWREAHSPTPEQRSRIEQLTHLASIAIERAEAMDALRRSEDALRRSQQGYALAMEASGEGHWDWDIVADQYHASPRMLELYGFPPGTTFKNRADFIAKFPFHPEDRPRWEEAIAAHFAGKTARFDIEIRMTPRGETRWVHLTGLLSRDASGKPVRWTGSVADITERRCAEDALRLSEQRYMLAMEATGDGHWDWDIPSDKIYVSPLLLDMCGLPSDITFASGSEWTDRFPFYPGERARYEQAVAEHFAGNTDRLDIDIRIVPRGETRWVHLTGRCSRNASGNPTRWAGSVTDITARKRVAEELRARQDMLDLAQKVAHAVAFEWRVGGGEGENRWSPDLEALYGLALGSYDGTFESWKKLVYADDWPKVREAIHTAQQTGDVAAEYRVVHPGGAVRWLQAKGRMFFPDGKPTRVVGFMLDVTDRHLAQSELQRMERELRQAQRLEAMGTLAGGIAHDFNNLLGAILGYGEMALRDVPAGTRLRRDVENIMIAGERGRALVDRILAFSRSGVGERVAVHVDEVVRETLALFTAKLPGGIVVEQWLDAGGAAVMGDPTQIHQVLMNLLMNAVHAMPSNGTLRVSLNRLRVRSPRLATAGTIAARDYVILDVADTGTGIAPEVLEKIFDPFFTTKEVGVGSGLGLSLVHGIVTGLGGAIDVATTVGEGTTFKVYLPLAGDVAAFRTPRKSAEPLTRRGSLQRVMVVDDEDPLVRLTAETLTALGYAAVGFTSATAALEQFVADSKAFDAVITDESMPGLSGSELIRKLRAIRPTIPILLVSGYLSTVVVERARDAGASEVLKKPLSASQLASALDRVLHASRSRNADGQESSSLPKTNGRRRASVSRSRASGQ